MADPTGGVWAIRYPDFQPSNFASTGTGIQAALDYVSSAGGEVYVGPGTFALTAVLSIYSGTWIRGSGIGTTILQRTSGSVNVIQNKNFTGTADHDITVSDLTLDGNASGGTGLTCIRFTNVTRGCLRSVRCVNAQAEGIAVYGNGAGPGVNADIRVIDCQFDTLIDSAIDVQDVTGLQVTGCVFRGIGQASINLEPNAATDACVGVGFTGNTIVGGSSPFGVVVQGDHSASVQGTIRDCSFAGNSMDGGDVAVFFAGLNLDGVLFTGNSFTNQNNQAFYALSANGATTGASVLANYVRNASTSGVGSFSAMEFANCTKIAVCLNRIQDDRGSPKHDYGVEFNAGSTGNWYGWNQIDGAVTGDIAPDASGGSFRTWGQYDHTGLLRTHNITVRYRADWNRTGTVLNINAYDDTGAVYHPITFNDGTTQIAASGALTVGTLTSGKYPIASTAGLLINGPTPLAGTKIYYVADSSGGAVTRKLTFTDGILTAET